MDWPVATYTDWLNKHFKTLQNQVKPKRLERGLGAALQIQHSKAFHMSSSLGALLPCMQALHPSLKSPINATEAMQGFILTTERRLIKILAPRHVITEDYTWRTCERVDWYYRWWLRLCSRPANVVCECVWGGWHFLVVTRVRGLSAVKHNQSCLLSEPCCPAALLISLHTTSSKVCGGGTGVFYCFLSLVKKQ